MKNIFFVGIIALTTLMLVGCSSSTRQADGKCHITGTANNNLNGKKIFLVPMDRPATMETVDSVVIENGTFEFTADVNESDSRCEGRNSVGETKESKNQEVTYENIDKEILEIRTVVSFCLGCLLVLGIPIP